MPYRFSTENQDYSDFASGRVLYSLPGAPAFPIRLASEIFQRARERLGLSRRLVLYDPTCGGAYHLTALGFLYPDALQSILASDTDTRMLELARRNLGLLSTEGMAQREREIAELLAKYGKDSHGDALQSAAVLRTRLEQFEPIRTRCFLANALDPLAVANGLEEEPIDLVMSDIPYGKLSGWILPEVGSSSDQPPAWRMLAALHGLLTPRALVAVAADKSQKIAHAGYRRVERFQIGKRQVVILQKVLQAALQIDETQPPADD